MKIDISLISSWILNLVSTTERVPSGPYSKNRFELWIHTPREGPGKLLGQGHLLYNFDNLNRPACHYGRLNGLSDSSIIIVRGR
jgi:hypothetical protein